MKQTILIWIAAMLVAIAISASHLLDGGVL
jgi:hypothetical protein